MLTGADDSPHWSRRSPGSTAPTSSPRRTCPGSLSGGRACIQRCTPGESAAGLTTSPQVSPLPQNPGSSSSSSSLAGDRTVSDRSGMARKSHRLTGSGWQFLANEIATSAVVGVKQ